MAAIAIKSHSDRGPIDFIGPFPPPIHGHANANEAVCQALSGAGFKVRRHNLSPKPSAKGLHYHYSRLAAVARTFLTILSRRPPLVGMSVDGGLGLAYGILLAAAQAWVGGALVIHHHSFAYIDRPNGLMRWFARLAPSRQLHVFLCGEMRTLFEQAYRTELPPAARGVVLSNAFMVPIAPLDRRSDRGQWEGIVLGHMSNLSYAKGSDLFLDLFDRLAAGGLAVRAVLAGPVADPALAQKIAHAQELHGPAFEYRGAVYGEAKTAFFAAIDVFVFPSRYSNEAQPIVLVEALAHGRPLATVARGCIACDHSGRESLVARSEASFLDEAEVWISAIVQLPTELPGLAEAAHRRALEDFITAQAGLTTWLTAVAQILEPAIMRVT